MNRHRSNLLEAVAIIATTCLTATVCGAAAQSTELQWTNAEGITSADKAAIVALARRVGIDNPRRGSVAAIRPVGGSVVIVASDVEVSGARRTWRELRVCRRDWRCASREGVRMGRWVSGAIRTEEAWRVADNDWFVDVPLSDGVSFATAERIVLAIRHHVVVNRLPANFLGRELHAEMPVIDVSRLWMINPSTHYPGAYEMSTSDGGSGEVFTFRIEGGVVELLATGQWIARLDAPPNMPLQPTSGRTLGVMFRQATVLLWHQ